MSKATTAFALAALCVLARASFAGSCSLTVSPLTVELQIQPGRAHTGSIEITNSGDSTQNLRVFCEDWTLKPDGVVVFTAAGRLPNSASPWTQVAPAELHLLPGETQTVRYTVRVPADAAGEARTAVIFEAEAQQVTAPGGVARIVPRVGTIIYTLCGQASPNLLRITSFEATATGGLLSVENPGPAHVRFTGRVDIHSGADLIRASQLGGFVVLPAPFNSRRIALPADLFKGLGPGSYQITVLLDSGAAALHGARITLTIPPEAAVVAANK